MKLFDLMYAGRSLGIHASAIGSTALAAIFYQTSLGNFAYSTDADGNAILDNQGPIGSLNDGLLNTGRALELGATNDLPIPIHHTLGVQLSTTEMTSGASVVTTGVADNYNHTCTTPTTTLAGVLRFNIGDTLKAGETYLLTFDAVVNSGNYDVATYYDGVSYVPPIKDNAITTGTNEVLFTMVADYNLVVIRQSVAEVFNIDISSISVKQITNPNSFLTYYDFTTGQFIEVNNSLNTPSTTYTFNNQTVNNILTHSTAWSASDLGKINNNPQLMAKLADPSGSGTISELDMVLTASDGWYVASENEGAYVVDARAGYGAESVTNGTFDTDASWTKGSGWTISSGTANFSGGTGLWIDQSITTVIGQTYIMSFDCVTTDTTLFRFGTRLPVVDVNILTNMVAGGTYYHIFTATSTSTTIGLRTDTATIGTFDNVSVMSLSSIPITNYAETIRTNADFNPKGLQTTCLVLDGAGVPTAYSDENLLQFNGDGRYVDTGFIHGADPFIIELSIQSVNITGQYQQNGGGTTTSTEKIQMGVDPLGYPYVQILGDTYQGVSYSASLFISAVYDGSNATTYINGSQVRSVAVTPTSDIYSFYIGARNSLGNTLFPMHSPIDHFKIITNTSQISNYDALQAYNEYLA